MEPGDRGELLHLCDAFVGNQAAPPQILDALRRFVTTEPKALMCQPLFRADEIDERKVIGGTLQAMIESHNTLENVVGPVFWSLIMTAPIHRLRSWVQDECKPDRVNYAYTATIDLGHLLKTFLSKEEVRTDTAPYATRNVTEIEKCRQRDRLCVLSGSATPTVCHIVPFSATKRKQGTMKAISSVIAQFWGIEKSNRLKPLLSQDQNIDCAKNMVCLEPLLHHWWGKAYFALEPIEKLPKGTRVCLRWLPRTAFSVHDRLDLNTDPRDYTMPHADPGVIGMRDFASGHPLLDGATFDLTSDNPATEVSFDMLELQWDLLRMAALCGAADAADDPDWNPGEDDPSPESGLLDDPLHDQGLQGHQAGSEAWRMK